MEFKKIKKAMEYGRGWEERLQMADQATKEVFEYLNAQSKPKTK